MKSNEKLKFEQKRKTFVQNFSSVTNSIEVELTMKGLGNIWSEHICSETSLPIVGPKNFPCCLLCRHSNFVFFIVEKRFLQYVIWWLIIKIVYFCRKDQMSKRNECMSVSRMYNPFGTFYFAVKMFLFLVLILLF
jgi:hypothetical protein